MSDTIFPALEDVDRPTVDTVIKNQNREFLDYVNSTPKNKISSTIHLDFVIGMPVTEFIALCQTSLMQMPAKLRNVAVLQFDDDGGAQIRGQREETSEEHISRCRTEFYQAQCAKLNRKLMYEKLKREFGDT